jgi:hypothetical protein
MRRAVRFVVPVVSVCMAVAGATAPRAQTADATPTVSPATPAAPSAGAPLGPLPAAPATLANDLRARFVAQEPSDIVTSKLVGLSIQNGANETIGQVADVVFDGNRTIKAFVVSVGGFLGIGAKYVAVDPSALRLTRVDERTLKAIIETDRDQLRAAPEYRYLTESKASAKADAKPADAKPGEMKPVEAKPAEAKPAEPPKP